MKYLVPSLVVGAGGFVGSVMRYGLSILAQQYSISFPHGTLWANLLGCLIIGIVTAVASSTEILSPTMRLLLATGICGGFTTMSSFVYELVQLLRENDNFLAASYFLLTLLGCILMFWLGSVATRLILKL
jgi:fluoride exporter